MTGPGYSTERDTTTPPACAATKRAAARAMQELSAAACRGSGGEPHRGRDPSPVQRYPTCSPRNTSSVGQRGHGRRGGRGPASLRHTRKLDAAVYLLAHWCSTVRRAKRIE